MSYLKQIPQTAVYSTLQTKLINTNAKLFSNLSTHTFAVFHTEKKANKSEIAGSHGRKLETSEVKEKVTKITPSCATASGNLKLWLLF